jgi:murein DD-endopeptidase MepM/ murein hydrolase activator NlpD
MQIEIDLPRPAVTALLVLGIMGGISWWQFGTQAAEPFTDDTATEATDVLTVNDGTAEGVTPYPTMMGSVPTVPMQQIPMMAPGYNQMVSPWMYPQYQMQQYYQPSAYLPMTPQTMLQYPQGGTDMGNAELQRQEAEEALRQSKLNQEILSRREAILQDQLRMLEAISKARGGKMTPDEDQRFRQSVRELTYLLQDKQKSESFLLDSYAQITEAQDDLIRLTQDTIASVTNSFSYLFPVDPALGISAYFHDPAYFKRFGFAHDAIDIPVAQGTEIRAVAPGIVVKAQNNGYGYNSVMIQHPDGRASLVGHVSKILVQEGQSVNQGDTIALSGGEPGTPGAGAYTTGAHVHFSLYEEGKAVNPLDYLPALK